MSTTAELINFDPLQEAEQLTGVSYKEDETTSMLGLALAISHNVVKDAHLTAEDDTLLMNDLDRYQRIITEMGFELVLDLPFEAPGWDAGEPPRKERYFIYAHCDGLLLSFDTYQGVRVNGGHVYYCWKNKPSTERNWGVTSSGSMRPDGQGELYWAGNHDCREALRHKIGNLRQHGTFLQQWPSGHQMFLWFLHHQDTKDDGYDHVAITNSRIQMLPEWVRTMINR